MAHGQRIVSVGMLEAQTNQVIGKSIKPGPLRACLRPYKDLWILQA